MLYQNYLNVTIPLYPLSIEQQKIIDLEPNCSICGNLFTDQSKRVLDHCHLTGKYRGVALNNCNLNYKLATFFPIFFHNLSAYDAHLFMKELLKIPGEISIIPLNKEFYISISKKIYINPNEILELRFLDSFRFMPSSLDSLASYLKEENLTTIKSFFTDSNKFQMVKSKGIFPYSYLNSFERLSDTQLPSRENFYNQLTDRHRSEESYQHAQNVWNAFECTNLLDYLLLCLKVDVLLLGDVFENFRKVCKKIYNLDPCQYYTTPGLSWDAMLKTTKIELELLTDIDMYNFIKKGIRGGLVQCSKRHSIANNKYINNDYDCEKKSNYIVYLDVNNLYGYAMSQAIPHKNFKWLEKTEEGNFENFDLSTCVDDQSIGYILEHNDLPFCSQNKKMKICNNQD
nr:probable DNA polymerase [Drosophila suzukii]